MNKTVIDFKAICDNEKTGRIDAKYEQIIYKLIQIIIIKNEMGIEYG
ncbi:hypothetical protein [Clostridium yunnanense]|nr:hypothetical protein [Clostridium yunnanense]